MSDLLELIKKIDREGFEKGERVKEVHMSYKNYRVMLREHITPNLNFPIPNPSTLSNLNNGYQFITLFGSIKIVPTNQIYDTSIMFFCETRNPEMMNVVLMKNIDLKTKEVLSIKKKSGRRIEIESEWGL